MKNAKKWLPYLRALMLCLCSSLFPGNGSAEPGKQVDIDRFINLLQEILQNPEIAKKLKKEFEHMPQEVKVAQAKKLRDGISEVSKLLPMRVDEYTILDSIMVSQTSVTQRYTLQIDLDTEQPSAQLIGEIKPILINQTCTTPVSGMLVLMGYTFFYMYSDAQGNHIGTVSIAPKSCGY